MRIEFYRHRNYSADTQNCFIIVDWTGGSNQNTTNNKLTFVLAAGRPNSNFLFLRVSFLLPPVARRLWNGSRLIPANNFEVIKLLFRTLYESFSVKSR